MEKQQPLAKIALKPALQLFAQSNLRHHKEHILPLCQHLLRQFYIYLRFSRSRCAMQQHRPLSRPKMSPNLIKGPLLPLAQHWQSLLRDPLRGKRDTLQKELWRLAALNALLPNRKSRIRRLINLTHSTEVIICQNLPKLQLLPLNCRKLHNPIYLLIFQWLTKPLQRHLTPIGISESPHNTNHLPLPEMHPHSCTRRHLAPSSSVLSCSCGLSGSGSSSCSSRFVCSGSPG